ncbi:hypothetical protein CC1G_11404 [Coprinopsis cinerea okayama7|uniref:Uncharacterized protein n=1 Tax=Coprinopsis cinerea (strain Okayama-7 / 130 / ATCC MYA-4618 / FGSC 9003) TaxID=240176 RepID=A8PGL8_COPC7|nr:hypothetical protein CC1G_11404 [Coprinopsis cinerea okayama7\|eukprot:XP_001841241.2 hypothetical protein CC1G_11404 [Coprinopsis cinerea okayama7\
MSKPTLIQRLLNQPSQKYADLPQRQRKDYFSSAGSMRRIAASEAFQTEQIRTHSHLGDPPSPSLVDDTRRPIALSSDFTLRIHKKATMATTSGTTSKAPTANGHPASTSSSGRQRDSLPPRSRAGLGATKMTSPPSISSVVTARTSSSGPGGRSTQPRAPQLQQNPKRHSSQSQRNSRQRQLIISDDDSDDLDGFDSSGDDEFDIFFTPNQTPRTSMASSSIAFPSKRGSVGSSLQPRKASRKSLRSPTPTQITPTNSNSPSIPGGIQNGHVVQSQPSQPPAQAQNHAQNQPRVDQHLPKQQPLGSSASASALLQQQHQRVASVNRKVSNPIPSSGVYPSSHQRRASGPDAPLQRQRRPSIPSAPPQTQSQQRKPSVPSTTTTPTQLDQLTAQQQQLANSTGSSTRTHSRTPSAATNIKGASTPSTSASLSRASSLNQKPPSGSSSRTPQPPLLHHPDSVPITKPHPNPTRITSTAPSNFSLSSTSLENHSDIFTASGRGSEEGLTDSTAMTSPVNSDGRGHKGKSSKSKATRSTRLPASYHTFSGATVQPQHRRANSASNAPELPQRDYSYTEDDWAKDVKWLVGSIVTGSSENVNGSAMPNGKTDLKRSGSSTSKRESERSSLGLGRPLSLTGKSKAKDEEGSVDKGKGKAREDDGKDDADGKKKKRKSGKVERDVVYYTATNGMPRPPPPSDFQGNGAAVGSSSAHPIQLPYQLGPVLEEEEGLGLRDNRLSVVLEGEEEPLTPKLPNGNLTPVRNSIATKSSGTKPDGIKRRKSRSIGDADFENSMVIVEKPDAQIQEEELPRQTSVVSWADDYKSILARTKAGKGNLSPSSAYTSSYLSNPSTSQSSFAYHNAIPVSNGELPSHGTPGFTSLHLPRAPQSIFAKDSPGWKSLLSNNSGHPQTMIPPMQQGASPLSGKVDLTRGGIAHTTMTSVEVVRGIAGVGVRGRSNKNGFKGMLSNLGGGGQSPKKKGVLGRGLSFSGRLRKRSEDIYGTMRAGKLSIGSMAEDPREQAMATISAERVLGFTGYRRPPTHVPSGSVLVQVWAVAVDGVDGKLVGLRLGTAKPRKEDQQVLEGAPLVDEPEDEERWRGEQTELRRD